MKNLKLFFFCCCQGSNEIEEEKKSKAHSPEYPKAEDQIEKNALMNIINPPEENSFVAAPSPLMDCSMGDSPKLKLRIIESPSLPINTVLQISPYGIEHSRRHKLDQKTYFGSKLEENGEILNDFLLEDYSNSTGKKHFLIKFVSQTQKYSLSDLGEGSGTFVKIDSGLVLKDGFIISFGNSHMSIHIPHNSKVLTIKFLEGPKVNEVYDFHPDEQLALVGRMIDCKVRFDDHTMSRYQCSIKYENLKGWVMYDGVNGKKSTNGTWIFVENDFEIFSGMIFKAGKTLFEAIIEN